MKKIIFIFLFVFTLKVYAQPISEKKYIDITLDWLIDYIEKNNIQILNQRDMLKYAEYQIDETKSAARPIFGLESSYFRQKISGARNSEPFNNYSYSFNLMQPLFTYGKVSNALKIAKHYYQSAETDYNKILKDISIAAVEILYGIKMLEYRREILISTRATLEEHFKTTELRYKVGDVAKIDYLSARVNYEQIAPAIIELDSKISNLKNELKLILNLDEFTEIRAAENIVCDTMLNINKVILIEQTLNSNDDLKKMNELYKIAELQKLIAKNTLRPELNLVAKYGGAGDNLNQMFKKEKENAMVGATINFPLFDGFRSKNQVSQFSIQMINTKRTIGLLKDTLIKDAENKLNDLDVYKKQIAVNELLVSAAEETFRIAQENYNAGAAVNLNVIEAEKDKLNARLMLLESKYNYIITLFHIKNLAGVKLNGQIERLKD